MANTAGQWHALMGLLWPTPQALFRNPSVIQSVKVSALRMMIIPILASGTL